MVIEIANATYRKGYGQRLDEITIPSLRAKLNSIIEWDQSVFPPKQKEGSSEDEWVEDREFLGSVPELKIGTTFKFGNQLIAVESEDTIVLVLSETGIKGLQRVWQEKIKPELDIVYDSDTPDKAEFEKAQVEDIPENWKEVQIPYGTMRLLKDRIIGGREDMFQEKGTCVKVDFQSSVICYPATLYLLDWSFKYDPADYDEDMMKQVSEELVKALYTRFPRVPKPYENPYEKRNQAVREAKKISSQIIDEIEDAKARATAMSGEGEDGGTEGKSSELPEPKPGRYTEIFEDPDDEGNKIEAYSGKLYYKVEVNINGDGETTVSLSDDPDFLEDHDYEKFGLKFEKDFQEYRVAELMESVFEVCDLNTSNYSDPNVLENKLKNHPDYEEGRWV